MGCQTGERSNRWPILGDLHDCTKLAGLTHCDTIGVFRYTYRLYS